MGMISGNVAFHPFRVVDQLRTSGILEAATHARTLYKIKMPLLDFYQRYRCMVTGTEEANQQLLPRFLKADHDAAMAAAQACAVEGENSSAYGGGGGGGNTKTAASGTTVAEYTARLLAALHKSPALLLTRANATAAAIASSSSGVADQGTTSNNAAATATATSAPAVSLQAAHLQLQSGATCVYLTVADHLQLEKSRFSVLEKAGEIIAQRIDVHHTRVDFLKVVASVRRLQRSFRGFRGRKAGKEQRGVLRMVVSLQRKFRNKRHIRTVLTGLRRLVHALMVLQRCARRFCARRRFQRLMLARDLYLSTSGNLLQAKELRLRRRRARAVLDTAAGLAPTPALAATAAAAAAAGATAGYVVAPIPPVQEKLAVYATMEVELLRAVASLISDSKVPAKEAIVKYDIRQTKQVLDDWAMHTVDPELKGLLQKVSKKIDYGYKLLQGDEIIPMINFGCMFNFKSAAQRLKIAAKSAHKLITAEHNMFNHIHKLTYLLEELLRVVFNSRKEALASISSIKMELVVNIRKFGSAFTKSKATPYYVSIQKHKDYVVVLDNIMRFGLVLYKYYQNYVAMIVTEYGQHSSYRRNFGDDVLYIMSLQQQVLQAREPMLVSGTHSRKLFICCCILFLLLFFALYFIRLSNVLFIANCVFLTLF
jgi:hypothetical protein